MKAAIDARQAAIRLGSLSTKAKSEALYEIHKELDARKEAILKANRLDVEVFRTQWLTINSNRKQNKKYISSRFIS